MRRSAAADRAFTAAAWLCGAAGFFLPAAIVGVLIAEGASALDVDFLLGRPRGTPPGREGGILPAIQGSLALVGLGLAGALPLGVGGAAALSEYVRSPLAARGVRLAAEVFAGLPSILYGLFGYAVFAVAFGLKASLLAGALTLALFMLPVIVVGAHEAFRAVDPALREAALALGATRAHVFRRLVFPRALPGVAAAVLLAAGHAAGSAAPVLFTASVFSAPPGVSLRHPVMTLPTHLYHLAAEAISPPRAAATALVLVALLFAANAAALLLRRRSAP